MKGHDLYITRSSISQWHGPTRHVQGGFCPHTWRRQKKTVGQGRWWSCSSRAGTANPPSGLWLAVSVSHVLGCSSAVYCYFVGQHSPSKFGVEVIWRWFPQKDSHGETIPSLVNKFLFLGHKIIHYKMNAFCTYCFLFVCLFVCFLLGNNWLAKYYVIMAL